MINIDKEVLSNIVKISLATRRATNFGGRGGSRGRGGFRGRGKHTLNSLFYIIINILFVILGGGGGGGGDFGGYRGRGE